MLKWMKVVVLLAGGLGVLAFFLPFIEFDLGKTIRVKASAYELGFGFSDPKLDKLRAMEPPWCGNAPDTPGHEYYCDLDALPDRHTALPLYFLSTIVFLLVGAHAIWRKRMDVVSGLLVIAGALLAIGAWLHTFNSHEGFMHAGIGAALLGVSGLLALGPAIAIIYWREPDPVPLFKIRVPQARIVRR